MQYVAVKFNPWDRRTYTYHNDGPPVAPGDHVRVDARGEPKTVIVESVTDRAPAFETEAVLGRIEPSEEGGGDGPQAA